MVSLEIFRFGRAMLCIGLAASVAWAVEAADSNLPILDSTGLHPNVEDALIPFDKATRDAALHQDDDRAQKSNTSPRFLGAVGLVVGITDVGNNNFERQVCTGNLIGLTATEDSGVVVTAGHCEVSKYDEGFWMTLTADGLVSRRVVEVKHETDYDTGKVGGVHDYAFLILDKAVPHAHVAPLLVPRSAWGTAGGIALETIGRVAYVAGYNADAEIGNDGKILTYDWGYSELDIEEGEVPPNSRKLDIGAEAVKTVVFEGGSGGAVILHTKDSLYDGQGGPGAYLFGINSYGADSLTSENGRTGNGVVAFIDQSKYKKKALELIRAYNSAP